MVLSILPMAFREIRRHPMRSGLTTLGIVIGVAAVIDTVTLGSGAMAKVTSDIARLGSNLLILSPGTDERGPAVAAPPFTEEDVAAIEREVPAADLVAPTANRELLVVWGNRHASTLVVGGTPAFFDVRAYRAVKGRVVTSADVVEAAPVCVLGAKVARDVFGGQDPVGEQLRVGALSCNVIGTLGEKGKSMVGGDQDDLVVMPLTTLQRRLAGSEGVGAVYIKARSERATTKAKRQIERLLRERRRIEVGQKDDFSVEDMKEVAATFRTATAAFSGLLIAIAAVSLVVGGIGIMNIMLVAVTERTREIGIRLAIGALARDVLRQFLVESAVLATLGGLLGIAIGLAGSLATSLLFSLPFTVSPALVLLAFGFSAMVGVGFGYWPARRAARLDPIEALRHE